MKTLDAELVLEIHDAILKVSIGFPGICPDKSLEGALQRIDNRIFYEGMTDLFEIAAMYGIAIAQGHIFNDANKRTALISTYNFLILNGYVLDAPEVETADTMVQVAEKEIELKELATWLKKYSIKQT